MLSERGQIRNERPTKDGRCQVPGIPPPLTVGREHPIPHHRLDRVSSYRLYGETIEIGGQDGLDVLTVHSVKDRPIPAVRDVILAVDAEKPLVEGERLVFLDAAHQAQGEIEAEKRVQVRISSGASTTVFLGCLVEGILVIDEACYQPSKYRSGSNVRDESHLTTCCRVSQS